MQNEPAENAEVKTETINTATNDNSSAPTLGRPLKSGKPKTRLTYGDLPALDTRAMKDYKTAVFHLKGVESTPKKTVPVAKMVVGLNCREALNQLLVCPRKPASVMYKFLRGCVANCENTLGMDPNRLLLSTYFLLSIMSHC